MPVNIRPATAADQAAITNLVRAANINPLGLDWRRFVVAEEDGQIVATGQIKPHRDGSHELASIATIPSRQREGIAGKVIAALLQDHPRVLHLMCRQPLESFYQQFGFVRINELNAMPPYFRRITRLSRVFATIIRRLTRQEFTIVVMKREAAVVKKGRGKAGRKTSKQSRSNTR